jgi:hypothetical protein
MMQRIGSQTVNKAAGTDLPDAASGFRAYSRYALIRLNVVTQFSYCMETIIQAGNKRLRIASVPVTTNAKTRESRLFSNIFQHMAKSGSAIARSFLMFKPHVILGTLGVVLGIAAVIPFLRFLWFVIQGGGAGNVQSLIFGSAMLVGSLLSFALLVIADLQRTNRVLLEDTLERVKELQYGHAVPAAEQVHAHTTSSLLDEPVARSAPPEPVAASAPAEVLETVPRTERPTD